MGKKRKAQTSLIALILIILIVVVAMAILWNVVNPFIKSRSEKIQFGQFTANLEIQEVIVFENGVSIVKVNRNTGNEEMSGLKFVFYDENGQSRTRDRESIDALETKSYSFSDIPELGKIERIGVAPIINNELGAVVESSPTGVLRIPSRVVSWWKFDNLDDFVGGNTCSEISGGVIIGVLGGEVSCSGTGGSLNLKDNMGISFWINGANGEDKSIIKKGEAYEISVIGNKINFISRGEEVISDSGLINGWNHVVISISGAHHKIYINKVFFLIRVLF